MRGRNESGGFGGPATVADGADVALGATTDAESVVGNGTVIALLKRHRTLLASIVLLLGAGLPALLLSGKLATDAVTATATAAAPVYAEGSKVYLSTDLAGTLRTTAGGGGGNPTGGRLDSIRYVQKMDTLTRILAGRLDSIRRVQKMDTLSLILAGRLDSIRRVQKMDSLTLLLGGRLDSVRRVQRIDTVSVPSIGVPIKPSVLAVAINPAANTAGTITLPAVASQFHYITHITIKRQATAALAGTAVLAITTTNLPTGGTLTRVGNAMVAGGTQSDLDAEYNSPIKSSVVNTASTVVFPAPGAAVTWSAIVHYYTAP